MNVDQQVVLDIRNVIAAMPAEHRAEVNELADSIRRLVTLHGDHGRMALALVGAELAAES